MKPLYPVYLYEDGVELPTEGKYYVVAKDGVYFRKETKVGSGFVKVNGIPWLQPVKESITLTLPKLPALIVAQALTFFRKVFAKYRAESYVTLLHSQKLNKYMLWCPKQEVSGGAVHYDRNDQPDFKERSENDWQMIGTIHSHCDFSAFHSSTDESDEATFDGVHITLGHVNRGEPHLEGFSVAASGAFNSYRESREPEQVIQGILRSANAEMVRAKGVMQNFHSCHFYSLELSEEEMLQLVEYEKEIEASWMPKVSQIRFAPAKGGFGFGGYTGSQGYFRGRGRGRGWQDF